MAPMYYRGAAAALLVFDVTDAGTFAVMQDWVRGECAPGACQARQSGLTNMWCPWQSSRRTCRTALVRRARYTPRLAAHCGALRLPCRAGAHVRQRKRVPQCLASQQTSQTCRSTRMPSARRTCERMPRGRTRSCSAPLPRQMWVSERAFHRPRRLRPMCSRVRQGSKRRSRRWPARWWSACSPVVRAGPPGAVHTPPASHACVSRRRECEQADGRQTGCAAQGGATPRQLWQ